MRDKLNRKRYIAYFLVFVLFQTILNYSPISWQFWGVTILFAIPGYFWIYPKKVRNGNA